MDKLYLRTEKEASGRLCPIFQNRNCIPRACNAWQTKIPRIQREDHSGARETLNDYTIELNQKYEGDSFFHVERTGGPGSLGILTIEAKGYCRIIQGPNTTKIEPEDRNWASARIEK